MACRPAPACKAALLDATRLWPDRDRASDGICGDDAHANRVSDHNPDKDGDATAFDIDHDPAGGFDARKWSEELRLRKDPRVKYVIFNGRMFSSYSTPTRRAWEWGPYTGPNAHKSHMHVSVLYSHKRTVGPWWFDGQEDDDLTPDESRMLRDLHAVLVGNRVKSDPTAVPAGHDDLATPILAMNGRQGPIQNLLTRIAAKVGA